MMRERIAGHLYRAINHDPLPKLALRIQHSAHCHWRIADEVLYLATEAGASIADISLSGLTIADLRAQVIAAGCSVEYANSDFLHYGAEVLLDGEGYQTRNNGDHIYAFGSLAWSIVAAYAKQSSDLSDGVKEALKQAYLSTAAGEWLDLWGESLGVRRMDGQSDSQYREWIVREVTRARSNRFAVEQAVFETTGKTITVAEPWQNLFNLDESALSGDAKLQDGNYWTYNVIRPLSDVPIDWVEPLRVIEKTRPAGVLVLSPMTDFGTREIAHGAVTVLFGEEQTFGSYVLREATGVLDDNMQLSDALPYALNYPIFDGVFRWTNAKGKWDTRIWDSFRNTAIPLIETGEAFVAGSGVTVITLRNAYVAVFDIRITGVDCAPDWYEIVTQDLGHEGIFVDDYYESDYHEDVENTISVKIYQGGVQISGHVTYVFEGLSK